MSAVETDVYDNFDSEVESRYVGELVMQHLASRPGGVRPLCQRLSRIQGRRDFVEELEPILAESRRKSRSALRR